MKNHATVADAERAMFQNWYRTESEAMPNVGAWMAWMARAAIAHAAPVGADVAADINRLPRYSREMRGGQHGRIGFEDFYAAEDVCNLVVALSAGTPGEGA